MSILLPKLTLLHSHGLATEFGEAGEIVEHDLLVCCHCQYTWRYQPGSGRKRGWCRRCDGPICGKPWCMTHCVPVQEQAEQADREIARQQAAAPALWTPGS